jgi:transcriptional regulator with XRE-family HTH domain
MGANTGSSSATGHFGRQMRKERLAHGWSLREFSARTRIDFTTASRIENGKRPPTEAVAKACDAAWPERRGWFSDYYEESKSWTPPSFRSFSEYESKAAALLDWYPGILTGLLQTEDYARAVLSVAPGATAEKLSARLASRMERQRRVITRDDPPSVWFVVDEMALYRRVGSPAVMAQQMRHLANVAALAHVTLTVMPAVVHPGNESGFVIADSAAYAEHVGAGYVFTQEETVTALAMRFDTLRAESYRASESLALIERMAGIWTTGVRAATAVPTAASALKSHRARA